MIVNTQLEEWIKQIKSEDFSSLDRSVELGTDYNFKEASETLRKIAGQLIDLTDNAALLEIPLNTEQKIIDLASRIIIQIEKIRNFVLKGNEANASNQHTQINQDVNSLYQISLTEITPLLERISLRRLKPEELEKQIALASSSVESLKKIVIQAEGLKNNTEEAIKEVRESLGKEGVLISSGDFFERADIHNTIAKRWFWSAIISLIFAGFMAVFLFSAGFNKVEFLKIAEEKNYIRLIQVSILKLVILSIAYLFVQQSIKNYKINSHLSITNRHRHLVLNVYPLMSKATSNPEQANIIVDQAAKAIFTQSPTGYLDGEENPNPINLTGVINKIIDKAGK